MQLRKLFLTIACIMALAWTSPAAAVEYLVKGVAMTPEGSPEAFATVKVFPRNDKNKPLSTCVTKEDGSFSQTLPDEGVYAVVITSVGREPSINKVEVSAKNPVMDLGNVVLKESKQLKEVTVTAMAPLVSREIDRISYDVQNDPESKTAQLDEILKKVPMVTVEPDGTVKIKGGSGFQIYKNGRKNNAFTQNSKDIFKSIPASMIKKIEVITDPGAREDAEGVSQILNIVTVENMIIKGVMGSAGLSWNTSLNVPNPNVWAMTQIDKVTLSVHGNMYFKPSRSGKEVHQTERTFDDTDNTSREETHQNVRTTSGNIGLELSYEIDSLDLLTAEFSSYIASRRTRADFTYGMYSPANDLIYSYDSHRLTWPARNHWLSGSLNYQRLTRRPGEKILFSYMISGNGSKTDETNRYTNQVNMPVNYTGVDHHINATFLEHTLQADWTRPLWKGHTLDVGAKYIYRDNRSKSQQEYIGANEVYVDFSHATQVAALFLDYRVNIGKFGARAGVRYEYSRLSAKYHDGSNPDYHSNLSDLVPNAALSYNINQSNSLRLSYSSSIQRPGIGYLNPTVVSNPQSTSQGNPDLGSVRNHSMNLNYSYFARKFSLDFSSGYGFSNNAIINIQTAVDDHLYSTYANAGKNNYFNLYLYMQYMLSPKTRVMVNGGANWNKYRNPSAGISAKGWTGNAYVSLRQSLPWKLSLSVYVNYFSGSKSLYNIFYPVGIAKFGHGLDLQRSFLKNRMYVRLSLSNPIGNGRSRYGSYMINVPYQSRSFSNTDGYRAVSFSLSYRFGNLNAEVKKVRGGIRNNDLIGGPSR